MFLGEHQHTLDAKGRVSLPAKFRNQLPGSVMVAKGFNNALYVFPADAYEKFLQPLVAKSDFDPKVREVRVWFMSGAAEIDLDSAGRIKLPANLLKHAGIDKDVAVIGNGDRIELWDAGAWAAYSGGSSQNVQQLAQELAEAGIL
jgi:MraZ protein